jgi:hypothetical protein
MVAPTPMPAEAPVLGPELRTGIALAGSVDSVTRPALSASVGAVIDAVVVIDGNTVEAAAREVDEAAEETTDDPVDSVVGVLVDGDVDCLCVDDDDELLVDSVVIDGLAYPLTVVNPTNILVVTVPPAT